MTGIGCGTGTTGDGDTVVVTTITRSADGTQSMIQEHWNSQKLAVMTEQKRALATAYAAGGAATYDGTCASGTECCSVQDLWMYDGDNQTGNILCLKLPDDDFLPNYTDSYGIDWVHWSWTVKSLWAGQSTPGFFDCWHSEDPNDPNYPNGVFISRNYFNADEQMHVQCHDAPD
jgi:hypothetical protein